MVHESDEYQGACTRLSRTTAGEDPFAQEFIPLLRSNQVKPVGSPRVCRTAHTPDWVKLVRIDTEILHQRVVYVKEQNFADHDASPQRFRTHFDNLDQPALHVDARFNDTRRAHD